MGGVGGVGGGAADECAADPFAFVEYHREQGSHPLEVLGQLGIRIPPPLLTAPPAQLWMIVKQVALQIARGDWCCAAAAVPAC